MLLLELFIDAGHDALMQDHGRVLVYDRHDAVVSVPTRVVLRVRRDEDFSVPRSVERRLGSFAVRDEPERLPRQRDVSG